MGVPALTPAPVPRTAPASTSTPSTSTLAATAPLTPARPNPGQPSWKLYDETTATSAIVDAVNGAKHVVNAEFFGLSDAGKGALLTTALEQAAMRGVEVNVIADFVSAVAIPVGSFHRMRNKIEDAGGSVVLTTRNPFSPRSRENPGLRNVDHRKVVTVDGTTGFVGGMNFLKLTDDYRDTMVGLSGVAAARLAAEQLDRWSRVGGSVTERHRRTVSDALGGSPLHPTRPDELRIVANAPEQGRFELTEGYRELIRGAKHRLWIASPGISDREVMAEISDAAKRGVDVRLIAPGKPPLGAAPIQWAGRAHLASIAASGGIAYEIPEVLHRKAIVADDEVILSSYNLTKRSADHDHELGLRTTDPAFVQAIAGVLEQDMARSTPFDPSTFTGLGAKLGGLFAKYLSY